MKNQKVVWTKAAWKKVMDNALASTGTLRSSIQEAIELALAYAVSTGKDGKQLNDARYLTEVVLFAEQQRAVNANRIKNYIKSRANVHWAVSKEKGKRFTVLADSKGNKEVSIVASEVTWYDFEATSQQAQSDFVLDNINKSVTGLVTRIETAIEEKRAKFSQKAAIARLKAVVAAL